MFILIGVVTCDATLKLGPFVFRCHRKFKATASKYNAEGLQLGNLARQKGWTNKILANMFGGEPTYVAWYCPKHSRV